MTNFGEYQLYYEPSEWGAGSMDPSISMKISAEATLSQMLEFFESFLKAAGYQFDSLSVTQSDFPQKIESVNSDTKNLNDFWDDDGFSLVGNPWNVTFSGNLSEDSIAYIGSGLFGSEGEDHISFIPTRSNFGSEVVTFS
jgi:hypothetical protein